MIQLTITKSYTDWLPDTNLITEKQVGYILPIQLPINEQNTN